MSYMMDVREGFREGQAFDLDMPFRKVCDELLHHHYRGMRSAATAKSMFRIMECELRDLGVTTLGGVTPHIIRTLVTNWRNQDLRPGTINRRINYLSVMGVDVKGFRVRNRVALKWWLKPDEQEQALKWLRDAEPFEPNAKNLARLIRWTTLTGLRIEESLRLSAGDFELGELPKVTVPGTKTHGSQATLAIGMDAADLAREAISLAEGGLLFPGNYLRYSRLWARMRTALQWPPNAELRAMRRSAARRLSMRGMPTDEVRRYLRHAHISTTMGYLHLTGGIHTEAVRKWV